MIRHTKSQRISGSEALALPASTTTTDFVEMSTQERTLFGRANKGAHVMRGYEKTGAKIFALEQCFVFQLKKILSDHPQLELTKVNALLSNIRELRRSEPAFRAVVFTQYIPVHKACVEALSHEGLLVYEFNGSTSAQSRDSAIRNFQNQADGKPAVFVITLRSGNVGITLTAASVVYLMEPSIDPAAEVQAAGRIHRLGQTKAVHVKKFVFKNSIESNIVDLHKEIVEGRISITNAFVPPPGVKILSKNIPGQL